MKRARLSRALQKLNLVDLVTIPIWQRAVKFPEGAFALVVNLEAGMSFDKFEKLLGDLQVALKAQRVYAKRVEGNRLLLTVIMKRVVQFPSYPETDKSMLPLRVEQVRVGKDEMSRDVSLPLWTEEGGTVTLIGGNPGQGKSKAIQNIVLGVVPSSTAIFWIDPKGGVDAQPFSERVTVFGSNSTPEEVLDFLTNVHQVIVERNRLSGHGYDTSMLGNVLLIVDEWSALGYGASKELKTRIDSELRFIAQMGRSARVSLILATQRPTQTTIDVATRELSMNRVAFAVGDDHASKAILGIAGAENKLEPLPRGTALVFINGEIQQVSFYRVPNDLSSRCEEVKGLKKEMHELQRDLGIFAREHQISRYGNSA